MTDRRPAEIVQFIADYHAEHGYYATVREIASAVDIASTETVHALLCDLVDAGHLHRLQFTSKSFVFAPSENPVERRCEACGGTYDQPPSDSKIPICVKCQREQSWPPTADPSKLTR